MPQIHGALHRFTAPPRITQPQRCGDAAPPTSCASSAPSDARTCWGTVTVAAAAQNHTTTPAYVPQRCRAARILQLPPQGARDVRAPQQMLHENDIVAEAARYQGVLSCSKRHSGTHTVSDAVAWQRHYWHCRPKAFGGCAVAVESGGVQRSLGGGRGW